MSTIAAISTAKGIGGIGIIRISGENAIKIANKVFVPFNKESNILDMKGYTAKYGKIIKNDKFIDEGILTVFLSPNSYTGENIAEISCHGGLFLTREVLRAVLDSGAVLAGPGEFTKRAFFNGKIDLSQAESVMDLLYLKDKKSNDIAFNQKQGITFKKIKSIKDKLLDILANLSVWADYPEEDIPTVNYENLINNLNKISNEMFIMIKNYNPIIKEGIKTVIIGRPNVGKSTLMNLISGNEKSIVTNIEGTTRDIVEENVMIGDIPILLLDTAGIRNTENIVEKIGVNKAKNSINTAELVLLILDASSNLSLDDEKIINLCNPKNTIVILNKIDLGIKIDKNLLSKKFNNIIEMSAIKCKGENELKKCIEKLSGIKDLDTCEVFISNERQLIAIKNAYEDIKEAISEFSFGITLDAITILIQNSIQHLMELTGENSTIETINKIFSKFCVGK